MDRLRRKRLSLGLQPRPASSPLGLDGVDHLAPTATAASSPTSSLSASSRADDLFRAVVPRALRSLSRVSSTAAGPDVDAAATAHNVLRKKLPAPHAQVLRRDSASSEDLGPFSRASTTLSGSSAYSLDWRSQPVERQGPLDPDPQSLRGRAGYLVTTPDYLVVLKSRADAVAAFPQLAAAGGTRPGFASPPPEPVHVIPVRLVVAVFSAESSRPSFGIEVWWRSAFPAIAFRSVQLFFNLPGTRHDQLKHIRGLVRARGRDGPGASRAGPEVEDCIRRLLRSEEPRHALSEPEIFPVAFRTTPPREGSSKTDDRPKKAAEGTSYYLAVGINMCFFVEIPRASAVQELPLRVNYQAFGLVALDSFYGEWARHEERFVLTFRDPFKTSVKLELASRYYKQIILTLMKADKHLKPAWPTLWQTRQLFQVTGLPDPQHVVEGEDFGGLQRTLGAFAATYRCQPVEWEINWKSQLAPEFRLLPPKAGHPYSCMQILAVLRALRYNDYFASLSFRDVDLRNIWGVYDSERKGNVAYMNRSCVCLTNDESMVLQGASVLHQEIHALCFGSETVRQIDFTRSLTAYPHRREEAGRSVQFLRPILDLLKAGLTKCNRLILRGCALGPSDIDDLEEALSPRLARQGSKPAISLEALDLSDCGLSDVSLKRLFDVLPNSGRSLQMLDVSGNFGRVPAATLSSLAESLADVKMLNVSGSLTGTLEGPLVGFETLSRLRQLETLDLSGYNLNEVSLLALDGSLTQLAAGGGKLRSLVLNNCGVTGHAAGRVFSAMTGLQEVHLHLNGNPLEQGITHLIRSIGLCWKGNFSLHMDMIEFRDESNYIRLVKALAMNRHVKCLSLVGTAPTPTDEATCSGQACDALEQFFAANTATRFVDMSGYSGKLDEGQLGRGVGRALRGLGRNQTITHLRMRSQNLHDNIGTLGAALCENSAVRFLDCEDNNFNLSSLRFLVKSVERNRTILALPLGDEEQQRILERCLRDMPQPRTKKKKDGLAGAAAEAQRAMLRSEIRRSVAELESHLARNRATVEAATGCVIDFDDSAEVGRWPSLDLKAAEDATPTTAASARPEERATVRSRSIPPEIALPTPYRVRQGDRDDDDDNLMYSPDSEAGSPASELLPTAPVLEGRRQNSSGAASIEEMWGKDYKLSGRSAESDLKACMYVMPNA